MRDDLFTLLTVTIVIVGILGFVWIVFNAEAQDRLYRLKLAEQGICVESDNVLKPCKCE